MKNSTKLKIIRFVERLLNYQQTISPQINNETLKILEIKWQDYFKRDTICSANPEQINHIISQGVALEMQKLGIIKSEILPVENEQGYVISGSASFILSPIK